MKENKTIHVLTSEEQRNLIRGSYCHQYGILFRLAMFTGLKTNELLGYSGLTWIFTADACAFATCWPSAVTASVSVFPGSRDIFRCLRICSKS